MINAFNTTISASATRHQQPATAAPPQSTILQILSSCLKCFLNPLFKIQNFLTPIPPVAVFAATPASGFVEMILHLPIHHPKFTIQN